jgi:hypothetical protein
MIEHHKTTQEIERKLLQEGNHHRLSVTDIDAMEHTDAEKAVQEILVATKPMLDIVKSAEVISTYSDQTLKHLSFAEHLETIVRQRVEMDLRSVILVERSWHADEHADNEHAVAFKKYHSRQGPHTEHALSLADKA